MGNINQISKHSFGTIIVAAVAAHNWFTINSFYVKLKKKNLRRINSLYRISNTSLSPNVMLGMSMQNFILDDNIVHPFVDKPNTFLSLPNLGSIDIDNLSNTELHNTSFKSNFTTSTAINYEFDEQDNEPNVVVNDDPELVATENAIEVLRLALDGINEDSGQIEPKFDGETSDDFFTIIKPSHSKKDDDNNDESMMCDCPPSEDADAKLKVKSNGNSLIKDDQSKRDEDRTHKKNIVGNDTNWVNQWSLKQLLKCTGSESIEKEDGTSTPLIYEDYFSRWSSDEDLNCSSDSDDDVNNQNNADDSIKNFTTYFLPDISFARMKDIDYYKQSCESWTEHLQLIGSSFETTLRSQYINNLNKMSYYNAEPLLDRTSNGVRIKKSWILDGMSIELVENNPKCSPEEQNMFMKPGLNLSSMEDCETTAKLSVQIDSENSTDNKINKTIEPLYESSATQTSIHELTTEYSYYRSLSMYNSSNNKDHQNETAYERDEKELQALKAYNAKTLWKDKRKIETEKFDSMHGREPNLLIKSKSLKSNNEYQSFKRKQRYQSKNINGTRKVAGELKNNSMSCKKIQVAHVGRHLNRIKASENIHSRSPIKVIPNQTTVDHTAAEYCSNELAPTANSGLISSAREEITIKNKIAQLDWTLSIYETHADYDTSLNKLLFNAEPTMYDVIDENDTADILQSAFSYDSRNTERGFFLGPASTDLYSLSEQIPNVFHEIIKAARIQTVRINCTDLSTMDIDYGETYYQNLTTIGGSDELIKTVEYSNSPESLNDSEIFAIDQWIKKLQKILLNRERNNENHQDFEQLTQMSGFLVLRRLINNLGSPLMISVSTTTSRPLVTVTQSATTSTATLNNNSIEQELSN